VTSEPSVLQLRDCDGPDTLIPLCTSACAGSGMLEKDRCLSHVFGSTDKEEESSPVSSLLPFTGKGLMPLQFVCEIERDIRYCSGFVREDDSPHFSAGEFLPLTRKRKDGK